MQPSALNVEAAGSSETSLIFIVPVVGTCWQQMHVVHLP
jgi:hypothetical protein